MAKWYGIIGYTKSVEIEPGIWEEEIIERKYSGDLVRNTRRFQNSGGIIDDINIANELSIIADSFAMQNTHSMRYVEFMGAKWNISSIEVQYPRLTLTIGGVYNGGST